MTIADVAREAAHALTLAGHTPEDSRRDVAVLSRHLLAWDTASWLTRQATEAPEVLTKGLAPLVTRRALGEPIAYLLGEREFYGRSFIVNKHVLIPRPETELLVAVALRNLDEAGRNATHVLEVGAGSGCVAVTIAAERAHVTVVATDISPDAIEVASTNATRHGVASRVRLEEASLTGQTRNLDVIVSNPPYVAEHDRATLMRDVRDFEPSLALFGGTDGLAVIRPLVAAAYSALSPGGILALEIGAGQYEDVASLLVAQGFVSVSPHRDLAGIERVVEARRPPDFI